MSSVAAKCEAGWFPDVPRGSLHDLARVWHDLFVDWVAIEVS